MKHSDVTMRAIKETEFGDRGSVCAHGSDLKHFAINSAYTKKVNDFLGSIRQFQDKYKTNQPYKMSDEEHKASADEFFEERTKFFDDNEAFLLEEGEEFAKFVFACAVRCLLLAHWPTCKILSYFGVCLRHIWMPVYLSDGKEKGNDEKCRDLTRQCKVDREVVKMLKREVGCKCIKSVRKVSRKWEKVGMCDGCFTEVSLASGKLMDCPCGLVSYCSDQCRNNAWKYHQKECVKRRERMKTEEDIEKWKKKLGYESMDNELFIPILQGILETLEIEEDENSNARVETEGSGNSNDRDKMITNMIEWLTGKKTGYVKANSKSACDNHNKDDVYYFLPSGCSPNAVENYKQKVAGDTNNVSHHFFRADPNPNPYGWVTKLFKVEKTGVVTNMNGRVRMEDYVSNTCSVKVVPSEVPKRLTNKEKNKKEDAFKYKRGFLN